MDFDQHRDVGGAHLKIQKIAVTGGEPMVGEALDTQEFLYASCFHFCSMSGLMPGKDIRPL